MNRYDVLYELQRKLEYGCEFDYNEWNTFVSNMLNRNIKDVFDSCVEIAFKRELYDFLENGIWYSTSYISDEDIDFLANLKVNLLSEMFAVYSAIDSECAAIEIVEEMCDFVCYFIHKMHGTHKEV